MQIETRRSTSKHATSDEWRTALASLSAAFEAAELHVVDVATDLLCRDHAPIRRRRARRAVDTRSAQRRARHCLRVTTRRV